MSKELIIIRGIPGTGKSHLAKNILGGIEKVTWFEPDMYLIDLQGEYIFDKKVFVKAHELCYEAVEYRAGINNKIIVTDVFAKKIEYSPYILLAESMDLFVTIISLGNKIRYDNVHDVPESVLEQMINMWED